MGAFRGRIYSWEENIDKKHSYTGVYDGKRVEVTNTTCGALNFRVLREVDNEGRLGCYRVPSLGISLKTTAKLNDIGTGMGLERSKYGIVCKAIWERLFGKKTQDPNSQTKRVEEWLKCLDKNARENENDEKRM
ncbi:hypothetical protein EV368DRAFT_69609 [Lentinula lateritia]|nr:hypothetical protein EV368DRAFT_69609 [Lentinula lateritia]